MPRFAVLGNNSRRWRLRDGRLPRSRPRACRPSLSPRLRPYCPHARPQKPGRAPKSKASRPEVQPLDQHLAALLNPALVEPKPQGFGEAPQPKFEGPAPESHPRGLTGATASAESLKELLDHGDPNIRERPPWTPHRPPRPEKSEGGRRAAGRVGIRAARATSRRRSRNWSRACGRHERDQVLLGVTGSGKTFTMAKVIEATQRPALILAPNKTLAAQLYGEFKSFFPDNAVEYFVSYYDYYQPEAYVPRTDTYIEKESDDQRADRPHAPLRDARAAGARRRHHRRLGLVHLRHRLGRDLYRDDLLAEARRQDRPAPAHQPTSSPCSTSARRRRFLARPVSRARRHDRDLSRPLRGSRLAHRLLRRRDRDDRRIRSADRREDAGPRIRQDLRQFALCDAAPDAAAVDQGDQAGAEGAARPTATARGGCSRRSGSSSAPCSISKCWRRPAPAPASRTIRAI